MESKERQEMNNGRSEYMHELKSVHLNCVFIILIFKIILLFSQLKHEKKDVFFFLICYVSRILFAIEKLHDDSALSHKAIVCTLTSQASD